MCPSILIPPSKVFFFVCVWMKSPIVAFLGINLDIPIHFEASCPSAT